MQNTGKNRQCNRPDRLIPEVSLTSTLLPNYLRADQQLSTRRFPLHPTQRQQLQALREAVEAITRPRDHAILLESVVVHDLEPRIRRKQFCQLIEPCRILVHCSVACVGIDRSIDKTVFSHHARSLHVCKLLKWRILQTTAARRTARWNASEQVAGTAIAYAHRMTGIAERC
jgi:hypothetical protein